METTPERPAQYVRRAEYQPLEPRRLKRLYDISMHAIEAVLASDTASCSSRLSARSVANGVRVSLHTSYEGPMYGEAPELLESDGLPLIVHTPYHFNSTGTIHHTEYSRGVLQAATHIRLADYPTGTSQPLVEEYWLEAFPGGSVHHATVAQLYPEQSRQVRYSERPMVAYDFGRLALALGRIRDMRLAEQPVTRLSQVELNY